MNVFLQMLNAMLLAWDKKGERYSFVNVSLELEKTMLAVLPAGINILRFRADKEFGDSEEARLEEATALLDSTTVVKDKPLTYESY